MRPFIYISKVNWGLYFRRVGTRQWIAYIGCLGFGWSRHGAC